MLRGPQRGASKNRQRASLSGMTSYQTAEWHDLFMAIA